MFLESELKSVALKKIKMKLLIMFIIHLLKLLNVKVKIFMKWQLSYLKKILEEIYINLMN